MTVEVDLPVRQPFAVDHLFAFLAGRAIPGVEQCEGLTYRRTLGLPGGHGVAVVTAAQGSGGTPSLRVRFTLADQADRPEALRRLSQLFAVGADPVAVDDALLDDPVLAPSVRATPGLRVPGSVDPFETAIRAVVGQQISVAGARTVAGRIVAAAGEPVSTSLGAQHASLTHVFPTPAAIADIDPTVLAMPGSRRRTVIELARRVAAGELVVDHGANRDDVVAALLDVPGIGPWTAGYVAMRGLADPDVFLPTDLGVKLGLAALGADAARAERWRPWRSYALHHLWAAAASAPPRRRRKEQS